VVPAGVPVPLRTTERGLPVALSTMVTAAARVPAAVGLNVTEIVQDAPAATLEPHVFVWAKSALFVPVTAMLVMVSTALPVFVSVEVCCALVVRTCRDANVSDAGDTVAVVVTVVPVPLRPTVWGLPLALLAMVTAALRAPAAAGRNVTLMVQEAPAARVAPQVVVWVKSPLAVPVITMLESVSTAAPVFVSVTALAALVEPTDWFPNASEA
jgi:hypothetical protein